MFALIIWNCPNIYHLFGWSSQKNSSKKLEKKKKPSLVSGGIFHDSSGQQADQRAANSSKGRKLFTKMPLEVARGQHHHCWELHFAQRHEQNKLKLNEVLWILPSLDKALTTQITNELWEVPWTLQKEKCQAAIKCVDQNTGFKDKTDNRLCFLYKENRLCYQPNVIYNRNNDS